MSACLKQTQKQSMLNVLDGQKLDYTPFWFMRQAGRYLPEYRAIRKDLGSFLDLCFSPKDAVEVTIQPIERFDMDAAILFSDILVIPYALQQGLDFVVNEGPQLRPLINSENLDILKSDKLIEKLSPVYEAISQLRKKLPEDKTLIGFSGAVWTVATYMVEGGSSKDYAKTKLWAYKYPDSFQKLIDILVEATSQHLIQQIKSGVNVVQIFDSWSGVLPKELFEKWSIEPTRQIVKNIRAVYPSFPVIGFPKGAGMLIPDYIEKTKVTAISVDHMTDIEWLNDVLPEGFPVQGNLDPALLLAGGDIMIKQAKYILDVFANRPFIFNLGHGIIKETPPEHVLELSQFVKNYQKSM